MDQNFLLSLKIFEDNSINYWACHGTLLGLIRDKKLIEWDHDIDFGLWYDETNKEKLINLFQKKGFNLVSDGDGYDFITFNRGNGKRVDINLYHANENNNLAFSEWFISKEPRWRFLLRSVAENLGYRGRLKLFYFILLVFKPIVQLIYKNLKKNNYQISAGYTTPKNLLQNFINININGVMIRVPKQYEEVIKFLYGENWHIPKKSFNWIKESPATKISNKRF